MPIVYKIDVLSALSEAGYSTYKIRREKLLAENTLQLIRKKEPVSWETLGRICTLLSCQPGDIIENIPE